MALIIDIRVNDQPSLAILAAQRVEGTAEPDSIGTYRLDYLWARDPQLHTIGQVEHRYGDGAMVLAAKVLDHFGFRA